LITGPVAAEKKIQVMKNFINSSEYESIRENQIAQLSRSERKRFERHEEKLKNCINSLTPTQLILVEERSEMRARELADNKIDEFKDTLDRCMTAQFILSLPDKSWDEIDEFIDGLAVLVQEDVTKILELKKECKGDQDIMNKTMQKCENEVKAKCEELLEKRLNQKKSIDILVSQFPMLSKSMLTNAYKKLKSDWDKQYKEEEVDPDIKEALESISDIIDGDDEKSVDKIIKESDEYVKQAEKEEQQPKVVCDGNSCRIEPVEKIKEEKAMKETKGLKVLSMTVKGENGTYRVCEQGVELAGENQLISFGSEADLDEWVSEYKQVFAMAK
jgi:hypothetical protein